MIAVVRIRGPVGVRHDVRKTLELLCLKKSNSCVLLQDTPVNRKRLEKVKDYVTWGLVSDDALKRLQEKLKDAKSVGLNPPRRGFGRKGVKIPFRLGGALGDRGEKMNDLILRMV